MEGKSNMSMQAVINMTRRNFLGNTFAALGFTALPGGALFAAPTGWKHDGSPNLVLGVVSDTHLRTGVKGENLGLHWTDRYFVAALEYFKGRNVDVVMHCGDMAHRGQTREMEFHAEAWQRVFGGLGGPVKLFITGNHDADGSTYCDFVANRYPDPDERARHVLATDMAGNWERIWGEKYEPVWHKEVKGYHFFGRNWNVPHTALADLINASADRLGLDNGTKPFFFMQHRRPYADLRNAIRSHVNAVAFFGHNHWSVTNWNMVYRYGDFLTAIQCASCEPRGCVDLEDDKWISKAKIEGLQGAGMGRHGFVVSLYDDMMVIERHDFTDGESSLGADWVMPFGKRDPHPFSQEGLKKVIGEPQFRKGAKLEVSLDSNCNKIEKTADNNPVNPVNPVQDDSASPRFRVRIPLADGNPDSRVYAYEVVVVGDDASKKLLKAVYAAGSNLGIGHEPDGGVTTLEIAASELPPGKRLTIAARPLTSLGTSGRAIAMEFRI